MVIFWIVLALILVGQAVMFGCYGMGPLKFIYILRTRNIPGNAPEYSFDQIVPLPDTPLEGKRIAILGSSVARGEMSEGFAVGEYLAARLRCELFKEAVSGTTLADKGEKSYIRRLQGCMDTAAHFDLFVCQLSTNDANKKMPLGTVSESFSLDALDTQTTIGAMEYIIAYAKKAWDCPVVFFTGTRYPSKAYGAMVQALYQLQKKWGIGILDLWSDDTFNQIPSEKRRLYMSDPIHPTKAGYRDWWGPEQERQLLVYLQTQSNKRSEKA